MTFIRSNDKQLAQNRVSRLIENINQQGQLVAKPIPQQPQQSALLAPQDLFSKVSGLLGKQPAVDTHIDFVEAPKPKPLKTIYHAKPIVSQKPEPQLKAPAHIYEKSPYHDASKFVPAFPMMAYHESGIYRSKSDPYAAGAISKPSKKNDPGGKTYGTYQFESYVYPNGTSNKKLASNSTLMRFLKWDKNPYGKELQAIANQHGVASASFDKAWKDLAKHQNKAFGEAQQRFLMHDKKAKADAFLNQAGVSDTVKNDPRIFDLVLGTKNHVDSLSNSIPRHIAAEQKKLGRKMTPNEVGKAITSYKGTKVNSWFTSSSTRTKNAVRARFKAEAKAFQ